MFSSDTVRNTESEGGGLDGEDKRDTAAHRAAGAQALTLLAERCTGRLDDPSAILEAIRETADQLVGGRASCSCLLGPATERCAQIQQRSSALVVPLVAGGHSLGVLVAEMEGDEPLDEPTGDLLGALGAIGVLLLEPALATVRSRRHSDLTGQYVGLAAHELRAPFAVMHGIITTLCERPDLPADEENALRNALRAQSDRTKHLIDQLLDLSRLEASSIPIERARFPLRARLESLVRTVAGDRADEVAIEVPDDLEIEADPAAFDHIVSNLVVNAIRHGGAPVTVAARQRDSHFRLSVEDRGRGVDTAFVPRLFERFARNPKEHDSSGSGLGLSIAQSYAHAHGGDLVYSPAAPHGARFELVLPQPR
jgi:signal transduction histidine kinase